MWMLDLQGLGTESLTWKHVCSFDMRSSLASEGGSAVAVLGLRALVAFGGYNGTYHNAVSVFKPSQANLENISITGRCAPGGSNCYLTVTLWYFNLASR
jgi:hypothetical protein